MSPQNLTANERRSKTVEAVLALAGRQNPSEITTAAIAEHMSVTQGALFRHFASKDAIWQAVMEWVADRLLDRVDRAAEAASSSIEAMREIFLAHVAFVVEHPGVPRMMFGELQHARMTPAKRVAQTLMRRYAERLTRKFESARAAGEIAEDIDIGAAAILFIGTIQGLVMQAMISGDLNAARANAEGVLAIYLRGLGATMHGARSKPAGRGTHAVRGRTS